MTPDDVATIRALAGLTQEELAARLGVARLTVIRWESGQCEPGAAHAAALAALRDRILAMTATEHAAYLAGVTGEDVRGI
jgi:transcriptional regulator with XRE-family HTH domain